MFDDQYSLFRDLDRRCAANGLKSEECRDAVRLKRSSIESELNRDNPIVRDVLAKETTFVAVYDEYSRALRGLRRLAPHRHDAEWNERLDCFAKIIPNVAHFRRRSVLAADNPVTCAVYGVIASFAIGIVSAHSMREDGEAAGLSEVLRSTEQFYLALAFAFVGFLTGIVAMLKYRTRDPNRIHAREAAAYMDLNYALYALGDDNAWSEFVRTHGAMGHLILARPDDGH